MLLQRLSSSPANGVAASPLRPAAQPASGTGIAPTQSPQLFVGVPASAQQTSAGVAHTPWLHQDVRALRPAAPQAQQVGRHWVGLVQALPGAPSLQVTTLVAPSQLALTLALAIDPASVTVTGDEPQLDAAPPPLEQPARHAITTTHQIPYAFGIQPSTSIRPQHHARVNPRSSHTPDRHAPVRARPG